MTKKREFRFRKSNFSAAGEVEIDKDMLILLMAIDESKTPLQIAREAKLPKDALKSCLLKLYQNAGRGVGPSQQSNITGKIHKNAPKTTLRRLFLLTKTLL